VGKTQIALELAYKFREKYPDCSVFWVPAMNVESIQEAYVEIGRQLGIPKVEEEKASINKLIQRYLSDKSAGRWLLVFDNADEIDIWTGQSNNAAESRRLIDYLPSSSHGSMVFTTRSQRTAYRLANTNVVKVESMDESAAKQLLSESLINQELLSDDKATMDLLEWLTFLPLAIVQAAAFISENVMTPSEYLAILQDTQSKEQDLIDILGKDFEDEGRYGRARNPVTTTWLVSFEQIQRRDPLAAEYLSFMACIDPKDIPQSLLPSNDTKAKTIEAIGTLSAYWFVTKRPNQFLDLHRLVHLATRNWLRREQSLERWTNKAIIRLKEVFPDSNPENRITWRAFLPHVRYVLEADLGRDSIEKHDLRWKFAMCLHSDGRYREAGKVFEEVADANKRVLGAEHPDTLISVGNLASTYWKQGRWKEAEELGVEVMETSKRVLGAEHPSTLTSMANLASTYSNQGRWKEAEELGVEVM